MNRYFSRQLRSASGKQNVETAAVRELFRFRVRLGLSDLDIRKHHPYPSFAFGYPNVHFLENNAVDIGDVRFVGGTLWTDFRLFGRDPALAMAHAEHGMNDFKRIKYSKLPYQKFKPIHAFRKHRETWDFIAAELRDGDGRKTVVVTHHAPSARSIAPQFRNDPLSACYASDLESLIVETQPALWVHGHVHHKNDYLIGETRVVSNSRGYPGEGTDFDPVFTVDV